MTMTTARLIELLQDADPEGTHEVRLATQPSWPIAATVMGVASQADVDVNVAQDDDLPSTRSEEIVWIVEGGQVPGEPYAPRVAWSVALT